MRAKDWPVKPEIIIKTEWIPNTKDFEIENDEERIIAIHACYVADHGSVNQKNCETIKKRKLFSKWFSIYGFRNGIKFLGKLL